MAVKKSFSKNAKIGISVAAVAVFAVIVIVVASLLLPKIAPVVETEPSEIVAIVPENEGIISVDADMTKVFATVKYKDGSSKKVPLSELIVVGLDTSEENLLNNVILDYGGFKQVVQYDVVPTFLNLNYRAATGGRISGDMSQMVRAGTDATRVQAIADAGYEFDGWSDGNPNASRLDRQVSSSRDVIARFKKLEYVVIFFYPDGTTAREQIVKFGEAPPKVPRAEEQNMRLYGYKFIGFDRDFSRISGHTDIYPLYEKYAADTILDFTLDAEGVPLGTSEELRPFYEKDQIASIRVKPNPDRLFIGWSIKDVDGNWVDMPIDRGQMLVKLAPDHNVLFNTNKTGTADEFAITFTPDEPVNNVHIQAHFAYVESEISFTSMGVKAKESLLIRHDQKIGNIFDVEDLSALGMMGYEFKGWAIKDGPVDGDGKPIIIQNTQTFTQPTELVAQWEKKRYEVIFLTGENENPEFTNQSKGYDPAKGGRVLRAYYQDSLVSAVEGAFPTEPVYLTDHTFKGWYIRGEDMLPTDVSVDKTYKIDREVTYVLPVFEVNKVQLKVSILEGAGSVVNLVPDPENPYAGDLEVPIRGLFYMNVNKTYRFRIKPAAGYKLSEVIVGDVGQPINPEAPHHDFEIINPSVGRQVTVRFNKLQHVITVTNGDAGLYGIITYNDETQPQGFTTSDATTVSINATRGSNKNIEILATDGNYIVSVIAGGVSSAVPYLATYHTLNLSEIDEDISVVVSYKEFRYKVTLPEAVGLEGGTVSLLDPQPDYAKNTTPRINIEADATYYIKKIRVNGWEIDPYQPPSGYGITNREVLNVLHSEDDPQDDRVTKLQLSIINIDRDALVEVLFAKLYFNITVSSEGVGTADTSKKVLVGNNVDVEARTTEGNYISMLKIDGDNKPLAGLIVSTVHTFTNVDSDHTVHFVFSTRRYSVSFDPSSGVHVRNSGVDYPITLGKTFTNIKSGSSNRYVITAGAGMQLDLVEHSSGGTTYQEKLAFNATTHTVQIDNIKADYTVRVVTKPLLKDITIYVSNKGLSAVEYSGEDTDVVYDTTVGYGKNINLKISPDIGLKIGVSQIIVRNKDIRDTYTYVVPEDNAINPNAPVGQYILYVDAEQADKYNLDIGNIKTSIDIFITFIDDPATYDVFTETPTNGTLEVRDNNSNLISDTTEVLEGTNLTYIATADTGYVLLALLINGEKVATVDGKYYGTMGSTPQVVSAKFVKPRYYVEIDQTNTNGIITSELPLFDEGESFKIKAIARRGYVVTSMSLTNLQTSITHSVTVPSGQEVVEYTVPSAQAVANLLLKATYAPRKYSISFSKTEGGDISENQGSRDLDYGTQLEVVVQANEFYYVSSVLLNGVEYSAWDLEDRVVNSETEEIEYGIFKLTVTSSVDIQFVFAPNRYRVIATQDLNGETLFKRISEDGTTTPFLSANNLYLSTGDRLLIRMRSNEGYHISSIKVNGVVTTWQNDLTEEYMEIQEISSNVRIEVVYTINSYSMKVNAYNTSVNYRDFDVSPIDYGRVSVVGYIPNENNEYTGFAHGSNVRVVIQPRTARGYYIDRFSIRYSNGVEKIVGENELSRNGGSYIIYNLVTDIDELNVEFRRRLFTFPTPEHIVNQLSAPHPWSSDPPSVKFTNQYNKEASVVKVDGEYYEYGTNFEISLHPSVGYSRTGFYFNGEDRMDYIRLNKYIGIVTSNIEIRAEYTLNTYEIRTEQTIGGRVRIKDEVGTLLWAEGVPIIGEGDPEPATGEFIREEINTAKGRVWAYEDKLVATYGTIIRIEVTPNNSQNGVSNQGYRINSFIVNNIDAGMSGDAQAVSETTVRYSLNVNVVFTINVYEVNVLSYEGGSAVATPTEVLWGETSTIVATIARGYFISAVKINGVDFEPMKLALISTGSYALASITEDKEIQIVTERIRYNVTFDPESDYGTEFSLNNGEIVKTAVSWAAINEGVPRQTARFFRSDDGTIDTDGKIKAYDQETGAYIGLRFGDKLVFHLTIPEGFKIASISVSMDDNGINETQILSSQSQLDSDDGSGKRTYTISSVTGNVFISVKYELKQYNVIYVNPSNGEFTDLSITKVTHYEKVTWNLLAAYGYYLSRLEINGNIYSVENHMLSYEKTVANVYKYSTDDATSGEKYLITTELLNDRGDIRLVPFFQPLSFNVAIKINNNIPNPQTDPMTASIADNKITYDPQIKAVFVHSISEGYSITSITFKNSETYDALTYALTKNTDATLEDDEFNPKDSVLSIPASGALLNMMDIHISSLSIIRLNYGVEQDKHEISFAYHLVEAEYDAGAFAYVNRGRTFTNEGDIPKINSLPAFTTSREFTDNISSGPHAYGIYGTFTTTVAPVALNKYEFAGFQEKVGDNWVYLNVPTSEIEIMSNGRAMRVRVTKDRNIRAVFFRLYRVQVEVKPEFKYTQGSFASNEPNLMSYRLYSTVAASANHFADIEKGVVLPNIASPMNAPLIDKSLEALDGKYEFYVRSGAVLMLRSIDRITTANASRGFFYYDITFDSSGVYSQGTNNIDYERGVAISSDKLVYSYAMNNIYTSFTMETEGALESNAGGTVSYLVNGTVATLANNSLVSEPNSTIEFTITPKPNYRFEAVSSLEYLSRASDDGFRRNTGVFKTLSSSVDGRLQITYFNESNNIISNPATYPGRVAYVKVLLRHVSENSIFKIKFWREIQFTRKVSIMTDEGLTTAMVNLKPTFLDSTSEDGTYDFGDNVTLKLNVPSYTGWAIRWQFVGYFVNGINLFKNLNQAYPTAIDTTIRLDNTANIVNKYVGGKLVHAVDVVARFIPVYNIVVHNTYVYDSAEEGNIYLDPKQISVSTIEYGAQTMRYFKEETPIYAKQADGDNSATHSFQIMGKINKIEGSKDIASSPYNTWTDNTITLNWTGAGIAGPTYKFLGWQYYMYDINANMYQWANIPYVENVGGSVGVMDYRRTSYTFPISALARSSYFRVFNSGGDVETPGAKTTVYKYDSGSMSWVGTPNVLAIQIRPRFQKVVPIEIIKEAATQRPDVFGTSGTEGIRPVILENALPKANFEYYKTITLDPAERPGYQFAGWYYRVTSSSYIKLEDTNPIASKLIPGTEQWMTYRLEPSNNRLTLRLDWKDQNYVVYARYVRIFKITLEVVSVSGTSSHITNALPDIKFYGVVNPSEGGVYPDPDFETGTYVQQRKITDIIADVGTRLMFKLETKYDSAYPNDWTKFNPRFDRLIGVDSQDLTTGAQDLWNQGDSGISTNVIFTETNDDPTEAQNIVNTIENAIYRVNANGDKYIKIMFRTEAELVIHNVYHGASIRMPDALAIAKGWKNAGDQSNIYVKDNGLRDVDSTQGIIKINKIPVQPGVNYDGVKQGDFGIRISELLSAGAIMDSQIYQRAINLDGNSITSKLAQFVFYGSKDVVTGYDGSGTPVSSTLTSPLAYPFAEADTPNAGDGSPEKPFLIETIIHLLNVNTLYEGNLQGGQPTLRYVTPGNPSQVYGLNFKLTENIDLSSDNGGMSLNRPLCSIGQGFDGIFNGNGKALFDIKPTQSITHAGIFAKITTFGEVKNLLIGNFNVSTGGEYAGALAGEVNNGAVITNVKTTDDAAFNPSTGRTISSDKYAGGLVGYLNTGAKIIDCEMKTITVVSLFDEYISDVNTYIPGGAGGLVGSIGQNKNQQGARASVENSKTENIMLNCKYASGGLVGSLVSGEDTEETEVNASIKGSTATNISYDESESAAYIGGVVGYVGHRRAVYNSSLKTNNSTDMTIRSRWSQLAYTKPEEPQVFNFGGGGIAGINFGLIRDVTVTTTTSNIIFLSGSVSGGIVGINAGKIVKATLSAPIRIDRKKLGPTMGSGTFGGIAGYTLVNSIIEAGIVNYNPGGGAFVEGSAAITVYTEVAEYTWAENFTIEHAPVVNPVSTEILGDDPGDDSSNLYVGGIVGFNKGFITWYEPEQLRSAFIGKIIASRRSAGGVKNASYVGSIMGWNAYINPNPPPASSTITNVTASATIEYYRYYYAGDGTAGIMEDYFGVAAYNDGGSSASLNSGTSTVSIRYEANGKGLSDHTNCVAKLVNGAHATNFPVAQIKYKNNGSTSFSVFNPINFIFDLGNANTYNNDYLKNNVQTHNFTFVRWREYYGKYRTVNAQPL